MIKWIVIVVLGLIMLGYMGIDIQKTVKAPTVQNNLTYAKDISIHIWKNYLAAPTKFLWEFFIKFVWDKTFEIIKSRSEGDDKKKTSIETSVLFSICSRGLV